MQEKKAKEEFYSLCKNKSDLYSSGVSESDKDYYYLLSAAEGPGESVTLLFFSHTYKQSRNYDDIL